MNLQHLLKTLDTPEGRAKTSPSLARLVELSRSRPEDIVGKAPHVLADCTCNPISKRLTL